MIKIRYWILAIFSAMSIHVFAFGMYTIKYPETFQPVPPLQEAGIEIDISMLEATTIEKQQATAAAQPMTDNAEETAAAVAQKPHIDPEPSPAKRTESKKPLQQTEIKKAVNTAPLTRQPDSIIDSSEMLAATTEPAQENTTATQNQLENTQIADQGSAAESSPVSSQVNTSMQQAAQQTYFNLLARTLAEKKRYPGISRRRGEQGVVQLFFIVIRDGQIREARIENSSGYPRLDEAVLEMLNQAQPLPPFPDDMSQKQLEVKVPVAFELNS